MIHSIEFGDMIHAGPNGIYDWIYASIVALVVITLIDHFVYKRWLKLPSGTGGGSRWFGLHVFCNLWIVFHAYPDAWTMFTDPLLALQSTQICSIYPLAINQAMHFYHMVVFFEQLVFVDWLHHGVMTLITVPLLFTQNPSPIINANHIFITGLPGAIDYTLLILAKQGKINPFVEKYVNRHLNVWVRAPGIFYITILGYAWTHYQYRFNQLNYSDFQFWCSIVVLMTNYWNAFYFLERVVGSYHKKLTKMNLKKNRPTAPVSGEGDEQESNSQTDIQTDNQTGIQE